ncbi:Aspartyl protease [Reichenbachiella faecimaris]|uniref:Aspartyl protease n=1 Tax=Reichenbachiella faecimaris TaxID=692418 RepID=A0A1W2GEZ1_REIFA|nr:aspartyl protease family protein [Reichenbachiella faecimaris]SMD34826.1 Aspartyl protease [Reichenbachiella faecimaris]
MKKIALVIACLSSSFAFAQTPTKSIPFELFGDHIIIQLSVDGSEPLDFIFDSGDGITVIDEEIAEQLHLVKEKVVLNQGTVTGALIKHNKLEIGDYLLEKNIKVYSTDLDHLEISLGRDFDGIIGYDLLHHHAVRIDYDNMKFEIYEHGQHPKKGEPIPFKLNTAIPTIEGNVVLNNGEPHPGTFFVMTGAGTTLDFNSPYAKKYDVIHKTGEHYFYYVKSISQDETKHYEGMVKSFTFGKQKLDDLPIGISQAKSGTQAHEKVSGILGNKILSRYNMIFDLPAKLIYMEKNKNFDDHFTVNCSGIDIQLSKDKMKVLIHQVFEGSVAEAVGIQVNAELVSINGKAALSEIDFPGIQKALVQPGKTAKLVVNQNGEEKSVNLALQPLL